MRAVSEAFAILLLLALVQKGAAIWCYRCTSATPGCADNFNWRGIGYLGEQCPESNDICVKIVEQRGAKETITRDCLSSLSFRTDIPADKYEGCRPASKDVRLANYVNHTVKEHDVKRDFFTNVEFCFCFLDHRCNGVGSLLQKGTSSCLLIVSLIALTLSMTFRLWQ